MIDVINAIIHSIFTLAFGYTMTFLLNGGFWLILTIALAILTFNRLSTPWQERIKSPFQVTGKLIARQAKETEPKFLGPLLSLSPTTTGLITLLSLTYLIMIIVPTVINHLLSQ